MFMSMSGSASRDPSTGGSELLVAAGCVDVIVEMGGEDEGDEVGGCECDGWI